MGKMPASPATDTWNMITFDDMRLRHTHSHTSNERYSQSASTNFTAIHCLRTHTRSIHTQKIYWHHRLIVPVAFATPTKTQRDACSSAWTLLIVGLTISLQSEDTNKKKWHIRGYASSSPSSPMAEWETFACTFLQSPRMFSDAIFVVGLGQHDKIMCRTSIRLLSSYYVRQCHWIWTYFSCICGFYLFTE